MPEGIRESFGSLWLPALGAAALFWAAALAVFAAFSLLMRRRSAALADSPSVSALPIVRLHAALALALAGVFLPALLLAAQTAHPALAPLAGREEWIFRAWLISLIAQATFAGASFSSAILTWYADRFANLTKTKLDDNLIPQIRRVIRPVIYAAGALTALGTAGVSITPLLAGLGIGGLAVALAVQPTLSNLFAGTYLAGEGDLNEGDFIEMDGGPAGFVVDVGWRATRIRDRFNNIILIPNSKLIESVVTNYQSRNAAVTVIVECGVSYESDLARVERVAKDAALSARNDLDEAVDDFEPAILFTAFGESNVDFVAVMQATDRTASFAVKHEVIKRIHAAFEREGIVINYPVRRLIGDGEMKAGTEGGGSHIH